MLCRIHDANAAVCVCAAALQEAGLKLLHEEHEEEVASLTVQVQRLQVQLTSNATCADLAEDLQKELAHQEAAVRRLQQQIADQELPCQKELWAKTAACEELEVQVAEARAVAQEARQQLSAQGLELARVRRQLASQEGTIEELQQALFARAQACEELEQELWTDKRATPVKVRGVRTRC